MKSETAVSQAIREEQAVAQLAQLALAVKDKVSSTHITIMSIYAHAFSVNSGKKKTIARRLS